MKIYTLDSETDPFKQGRTPAPFAWGLFNGERYWYTWGKNCTEQMLDILYKLDPGIVYMHNGGKFDIFFLLKYIDTEKDILIIKDRITQCYFKCAKGYHRVRDSVKILPFSLDTYQKTKIDYDKFEADKREGFKDEIVSYLKDDCVFLWQLVDAYVKEFGLSITIGSTAIKELQKYHYIGEPLTANMDARIRQSYFHGGRVERYKTGVFPGEWKCFDVNSMYPFVMSNFYHPIGHPTFTKHNSYNGNEITKDTYFITASGDSDGAFPLRTNTGIDFPRAYGTYCVSIHEWQAAQELDLFHCDEIIETVDFEYSRCFVDYVTHYYNLRKKAKIDGDKIKELFYKFLLNNSYGKFAINPENFKDYRITDNTTNLRYIGFDIATTIEEFDLILWSKNSDESEYNNIATGASITGAARSVLLRGLQSAIEPIYCDTDSIICRDLQGVDINGSTLGAWKLEKTGDSIAIAGKKMYALFEHGECVKAAHKGVKITPQDIVNVALGNEVIYHREAPTFRLNGDVDWITRKVRIR